MDNFIIDSKAVISPSFGLLEPYMFSALVCIIWLAYSKVNLWCVLKIFKWVILGYNARKVLSKERDCLRFVQLVLLEEVLLISSGMIFLEGFGERLRQL